MYTIFLFIWDEKIEITNILHILIVYINEANELQPINRS